MKMVEYRVLELFSGIGGMHYALQGSEVKSKVVAAIDINTVANHVYKHNFPDINLMNRNIQSVSADFINTTIKPNMLLMSPPCQPFTRNGLQKDCEDARSDAFLHILKILKEISCLNYILVENVKGFETSNSRNLLIESLTESGFCYQEFLLTPHQFGIPNSRLRYYCLARRKEFKTENKQCIHHALHKEILPCFKISSIIENSETDSYNIPSKFMKRAFVLDICYPDSERSCCFTKAYTHFLEGTGSVYTETNRQKVEESFKACADLDVQSTEYMDTLTGLKLRYFTPKEVSRLMAFPKCFDFPSDISRKQCYRLLGNSINVKVVSDLIKYLIDES